MSNLYDEVRSIIQQHQELERAIASNASGLGKLLKGNLRLLSPYDLKEIKNELRLFNSGTKRWRKPR